MGVAFRDSSVSKAGIVNKAVLNEHQAYTSILEEQNNMQTWDQLIKPTLKKLGFGKLYRRIGGIYKRNFATFYELIWNYATWFSTLGLLPRKKDTKITTVNSFLDNRSLLACSRKTRSIRHFDSYLRRIVSPNRANGIKVHEYCILLDYMAKIKGMCILDVGCGKSTFCLYLKNVWLRKFSPNIVTFDLPTPFVYQRDKDFVKKLEKNGIRRISGDMRNLPFRNESFDLVTSFSAIEHLHQEISNEKQVKEYDDFLRDTRRTVQELGRVTKKGGMVYITSDVYHPQLQKTDVWWKGPQHGLIVAAYKFDDFFSTFVEPLKKQGFAFHGRKPDFDFSGVINDENRSNYRGRYITTFYLLMRKSRE